MRAEEMLSNLLVREGFFLQSFHCLMNRIIFEDLFVLEMANNHYGKLERGLQIIREYSRIVRFNNVRAAIKVQLRDVDSFIHKDFRNRTDIRYIKKTIDTQMPRTDFQTLT